ncbi:hypothetical protein BBF96_08695 [Anoxybacter fermentans]|uniref:Penicillin-binding protein 1A n=1 Tax=Anoxybacter fermentans TaxID=1323375 RepID=A0A3S9SYN3_9FIRM|nr:biosynthetic peptidoglycan transglycosylase [Anoxybacter fermentans]AZR73453.1 hypothetical protein BBF96_08695 [Anoxybacter fermentans]
MEKNIKKKNRISLLRVVITIIVMLVIGIILYYGMIIIEARKQTPEIVRNALNSENIKLDLSDLSKEQIKILLMVEDPNFYNHNGVDLRTPGAGITTITQGLVKKLYFRQFKPGISKIKQTLIARYALDPLVPKNEQLKLFINLIYLGKVNGKPVYGLYEAAKQYYNKSVSELNEDEYISIIAMIIAPETFGIQTNPDANKNRVEHIKKLISGEYKPKGLMDLYYGGKTYRNHKSGFKKFLDRLIWGY